MGHKHKVEDTRKRSLLKALTSNGLEVLVDTILFDRVLSSFGISILPLAFGLSVTVEFLCFVTNYLNDRAWNRIQWGRKVIEIIVEDEKNR